MGRGGGEGFPSPLASVGSREDARALSHASRTPTAISRGHHFAVNNGRGARFVVSYVDVDGDVASEHARSMDEALSMAQAASRRGASVSIHEVIVGARGHAELALVDVVEADGGGGPADYGVGAGVYGYGFNGRKDRLLPKHGVQEYEAHGGRILITRRGSRYFFETEDGRRESVQGRDAAYDRVSEFFETGK